MKEPNLSGTRVTLKLAQKQNIPEILNFYKQNQTHLTPFEPKRDPSFYTEQHWQAQLEKRIEEYKTDQSMMLFIFLNSDPAKIIGTLNFTKFIRGFFQACNIGYNLSKDHEGQGYMSESLRLAIDHAFKELNLHRLMANYLPDNTRSAALLERLGFTREGLAKDYLFINGAWRDHVLTSLINPNWKP